MRLRNVPTAARAAAVGRGIPPRLALRAEPLWASSMGFILAGGVVTVYVEMVGDASLKRTSRARGVGTVVSGGCECDAPSIASGVLVVGCGRRSGACMAVGCGVVVVVGVVGTRGSSRAADVVAATGRVARGGALSLVLSPWGDAGPVGAG